MRQVKFKDYNSEKKQWIEGTGIFHRWGDSFEQMGQEVGKFTFGIVENIDGSIHEVAPHHLQFLDKPTPANF